MHHGYMHQASVLRCITHTYIRVKDQGSSIIDICTLHKAIRIQDHRYMYHGYMHSAYMNHGYMHPRQKHPGRGFVDTYVRHICASESRIIDICIYDVLYPGPNFQVEALWPWAPTPRIGLFVLPSVRNEICRIIDTYIRIKNQVQNYVHHTYVKPTHMHQDQGSQTHASYTHASGSKMIDICIMHTCNCIICTCIWIKGQLLRIMNICIMHACIRIKGQGPQIYASYTHSSYLHTSGSRIIHTCIKIKGHR